MLYVLIYLCLFLSLYHPVIELILYVIWMDVMIIDLFITLPDFLSDIRKGMFYEYLKCWSIFTLRKSFLQTLLYEYLSYHCLLDISYYMFHRYFKQSIYKSELIEKARCPHFINYHMATWGRYLESIWNSLYALSSHPLELSFKESHISPWPPLNYSKFSLTFPLGYCTFSPKWPNDFLS